MLKTLRLKKEFDLVYKKGKSFYGSFFSLRVLQPTKPSEDIRFAIVISTKISKKAVVRNEKRRQLKEIVRLNTELLQKGIWFLVTLSPEAVLADYHMLEKDFLDLMRKAKIIV